MKRSKTAHANIACVLFLISTGAAADTFIYNGLKLRPLGAKETGIRNIIVTGSGTRPKKAPAPQCKLPRSPMVFVC
jgi:hypothetical protein